MGRVYSWNAAQNACPEGWHLPSEEELKSMAGMGETVWTRHTLECTPEDCDSTAIALPDTTLKQPVRCIKE